jgi:cobalt-zinc-cadmium efflux system membrane fusion protein
MRVKKGEVIATLEGQDYIQLQQDYYEHVAALEFLEVEFARQETLAKENVNAQKTFQLAKSQYQSKKAMVAGIKAKLQLININPDLLIDGKIFNTINLFAPISGYVTEVYVNIGKYVNTTDVLFKIVDTEHLHAELYVFEKDIPNLKIGQQVEFSLVNESLIRKAHVYLIGREIGEDRSLRIHCHLDTEDPTLLPGMYLKANIQTEANMVNTLPDEAVLSFEGEFFVFIQKATNEFKLVKVDAGRSVNGFTEIFPTAELSEDTEVVITGAFDLLGKLKNMEDED